MPGNILDFIDGIESGDAAASRAGFNSIMTSKMQDVIDTQRIHVASQFYNDVPPVEASQEEE